MPAVITTTSLSLLSSYEVVPRIVASNPMIGDDCIRSRRLTRGHSFGLRYVNEHNIAELGGGAPVRGGCADVSRADDADLRATHISRDSMQKFERNSRDACAVGKGEKLTQSATFGKGGAMIDSAGRLTMSSARTSQSDRRVILRVRIGQEWIRQIELIQ